MRTFRGKPVKRLAQQSTQIGKHRAYLYALVDEAPKRWQMLEMLAETPVDAYYRYNELVDELVSEMNELLWWVEDTFKTKAEFGKLLIEWGIYKTLTAVYVLGQHQLYDKSTMDVNTFSRYKKILHLCEVKLNYSGEYLDK